TQMIARVEIIPRIWPGFHPYSLWKEPLRHRAKSIAFLAQSKTEPPQPPQRHLGAVEQLSDGGQPALPIVAKLGPLVPSVDCYEPVLRIPFIGPRSSGHSRSADFIQPVIARNTIRRPNLFSEPVA